MRAAVPQILLVEDNRAEARLAREALAEAGVAHRLHLVRDGVAALAFLRRTGVHEDAPRPDLVLLDLNLPRKDGRDVLREIKLDENLRCIPVVILTTSNAEQDIAEAYDLHANCYIAKPMDMEGLVRIVKSIHGFWLSMLKMPEL